MKLLKFIQKSAAKGGIWFLMAAFAFAYGLLSLIRHSHFESFGFDLGIFDQEIWLYSRFKAPISTVQPEPINILGDHFTPSLALFAPLFWVWNEVRFLLLVQVLAVVSGAYPIYKLGKKILKNDYLPLVIAYGYLAFFGLQNAIVFDFHPVTVLAGFFPWLFYFLEQKRWGRYWLWLVFCLGLKEDVSIMVVGLGFYLIWRQRDWKGGLITSFLGIVWFWLTTRYLIPLLGQKPFAHESQWPVGLAEWWQVFAVPSEKWRTVFWSFFPFGFLPLLSPEALPMAFLHFLEHFIDPKFAGRWGMALHYRASLAPVLAIGSIWGIKRTSEIFKKGKKKAFLSAGGVIMGASLASQWFLHLPLNTLSKPQFYKRSDWMKNTQSLIEAVPAEASVATQNNLLPHLSHREEIYLFTFSLDTKDAGYLLVDLRDGQPSNNFWSQPVEKVRQAVDNLKAAGLYRVVKRQGEAYLLEKNGLEKTN